MASTINYTPPATISRFIKDHLPGELFYDWIVGPVGSGKTTGIFMKLVYMAGLQAKGPDGIRRSRAVIVRNTSTQLRDTTLNSWFTWFKDGQAGKWYQTDKNFVLKYGDVECEVLFRPLDSPQDIARVLSLEVTFAIVDEFVEIPQAIIDALSARCGRYPSKVMGRRHQLGHVGIIQPVDRGQLVARLSARRHRGHPARRGCQSLHHRIVFDERNARYFLQPSGYSPLPRMSRTCRAAATITPLLPRTRPRRGSSSSSKPSGASGRRQAGRRRVQLASRICEARRCVSTPIST
jgi:hypothetical protein